MIPDVNNIVYASDLQPGSRPAFRMAVRLALSNNARLLFITVIEDSNEYAKRRVSLAVTDKMLKEMETESMDRLQSKMINRLERFIEEEMEQGIEFPQGKPELHVIEGTHAGQAIVGFADRVDADLIVMGKRRKHGMDKLLVGSVANKVLKSSHIPVLMVPLR
ncbi:universal stress protein [Endozoicomonas lisbonensis]|uniref:Nucleotide-binding universal stress UspA family protein n=1 Tax=Endozoicomonas lisbonensis TaxID=3120522 RepID=A0ABV2SII2_9GAMM